MNISDHAQLTLDQIKGTVRGQTESAPKRRFSKTSASYWTSRIKQRSYTDRDGQAQRTTDYSVRLKINGGDTWFPLGTASRDAAASHAAAIFSYAKANGLRAASEKFKPDHRTAPPDATTLGQWLKAVELHGGLRPVTLGGYQRAIRSIAASIGEVKGARDRFDYKTGGAQLWRDQVDAVPLAALTMEAIESWRRAFLTKGDLKSHAARMSRQRTADSLLRQARSLFIPAMAKRIGLPLPAPVPFSGIEPLGGSTQRFAPTLKFELLITAARNQLRKRDHQAWLGFLLCGLAGLRKGEADALRWQSVDLERGVLRVEPHEFFLTKTADSHSDVPVDPEVVEELKAAMAKSLGDFVLIGKPPKEPGRIAYYRAEKTWDRLIEWLRNKGITSKKPVHELRKLIGAHLATNEGIYAASIYLRHSDLTTTSRHYAAMTKEVRPGLGKLLKKSAKVPTIVKEAQL